MKTKKPNLRIYHFSMINGDNLNPIELLIYNLFLSYLEEDPELHISAIHDDFLDNTKTGSSWEDIKEYGFTEIQLLEFCHKFKIETDWDTNQIIKY